MSFWSASTIASALADSVSRSMQPQGRRCQFETSSCTAPNHLLTASRAEQSFERISTDLDKLSSIADNFESKGIPGLLRGVPDFSSLLDEIKELYDGEGESTSPLRTITPDALFTAELLPVDGKDEDYEVSLVHRVAILGR